MYAVVTTGNKQYKVSKDQIIKVEKIEANVGDSVTLDVLMLNDEGKVLTGKDVASVKATAEVVAQDKAKKIVIFKYKAKKNERKRQGHRQPFTALKITDIK